MLSNLLILPKLRFLLLFGFICFGVFSTQAQIGGQKAYDYLNLPTSAVVTGLGGVNITNPISDVNMFLSNPALLNEELAGKVSLNYHDYYAGVNFTSLAYADEIGKAGMWSGAVQYLSYGEFDAYDPAGASLGTFAANEFAVSVGHNHSIDHFSIGANMKFASSNIGSFNSSALLFDVGGLFRHPNGNFTAGLTFKNVGFVLKEYNDDSDSELPLDVQAGITFKPKHMPFRLSITGRQLNSGDITFFDPNGNISPNAEEPETFDKVFRHIVIGPELLLSKNVNIRFGYNHLVRKELRLEQTSGGAGFSFGLMFRIKAFEFNWSKAYYHVAGGTNFLTLTYDLNNVVKRVDKVEVE